MEKAIELGEIWPMDVANVVKIENKLKVILPNNLKVCYEQCNYDHFSWCEFYNTDLESKHSVIGGSADEEKLIL